MEHHERLGLTVEPLQHRLGDVVVDGLVAVAPRRLLVGTDVGRVREVPEVVLGEPELRVRDDAVEELVRGRVGGDEIDPVGAALELDLGRPARLAGDGDVLLGHRRGDPEHLAMGGEPGQRRHQPAAAAGDHPVAVGIAVELGGPAVRDDDQRLAPGHYPDAGRLPSVTGIEMRFVPRTTVNVTVWPGRRVVVTSLDTSSASSTFVPAIATIRSPPRVTSWPLNASVREPP